MSRAQLARCLPAHRDPSPGTEASSQSRGKSPSSAACQALEAGCATRSASSIPASWLHWAPANLPGVEGQRMSQLSLAQGMRAELQVMEQRGIGTSGCSQTPPPARISCRSFSQCPGLYSWVLWHWDCSRCPLGLGFWSDHL